MLYSPVEYYTAEKINDLHLYSVSATLRNIMLNEISKFQKIVSFKKKCKKQQKAYCTLLRDVYISDKTVFKSKE